MSLFHQVLVGAAALAIASGAAPAAAFPNGPIEFVIPFEAGDGADIEGRLLAEEMGKLLGVALVPVNRPGGGGAVTYAYLTTAKPDGQTVGWSSTSVLTATNLGNTDFDYTAMDHIGRVEFQPQPFVVRADAPWQTFGDFVKACKAAPDTLKIANSGTGSSTHAAAIMLMDAAGCEVIHLPKGAAERNTAVLNGEADAMIAPLGGVVKLTQAGKFRILLMPSDERNEVFPDVPTAKESGYDVTLDLFRSLSVPAGTPGEVKAALAAAMIKAAESPTFEELAKNSGFTIAPMDEAEFAKYLADENVKVEAIFKSAGLYKTQ